MRPKVSAKDLAIAKGWLTNPPSLPPTDSPFDFLYPEVIWVKQSLSQLVTDWGVSAAEAEEVFISWAKARRKYRKLKLADKRNVSEEEETKAMIWKEFYLPEKAALPTSERLRLLADEARALEARGWLVSLGWLAKVFKGPQTGDQRASLRWLMHRWFVSKNNAPPLCLCSDTLILEITSWAGEENAIRGIWSTADAIKHQIHDYGLYRPKGVQRFRKGWVPSELGD